MTTVYIVASGEYSDYSVEAVFTTEQKAIDFCKLHNTRKEPGVVHPGYRGDFQVEEYELDPETRPVPKDKFGYYVVMSKDGSVSLMRPVSIMYIWERQEKPTKFYCAKKDIPPRDGTYFTTRCHFYPGNDEENLVINRLHNHECVELYVLARDEQHAIKVANEKRAQIVALNRWPTSYDQWGHAEIGEGG